MTIQQYIDNLNQRYKLGNATEHTFRGDLQQLLESLVPDIRATNEPKRQSCGAPDYILTKRDIPVGFIEAKDIGDKDLDGLKKTGNKEQFDRYKESLDNLIFTDYINFHLYRDGEFITKISIAQITDKGLQPIPENFSIFSNLIREFSTHIGQNIKSSKKLAEMMAGKARLLSDIIAKALLSDEDNQENSTLREQMLAFKKILIHDITPQGFADVYAQTIAYGMFAARLHDSTLPTFGRQEAAELIPKTNPFLRKLFGYIAGPDIDDRIKWVVDSLADIFQAANVDEILHNYGKSTKMEDPIIHFYENFLSEYDPKLRKARGVWYTPQPLVNFIVRAVDDILKTEFNLTQGLADTTKTNINLKTQTTDNRTATGYKSISKEVHKVQILDPATGTGTFLAEIIRQINAKFQGQQGLWSDYVDNHLLPRVNGFELLMASYAMAHLKLDLLLRDTGYKSNTGQRFRVYLTNSLEESHPDTGTFFANWLSTEANEANHIKRDTPVMCIIGNPPYSISSTNKSKWIENLISDYKKDLNERKINIDDDYIKFIRYGQHYIDKNGSGILAYISNNSFIDGVTHRQMRKNLLESFDKIYILDLHGNARKKEVSPDGSPDQNVFDIMQGVSINFFIKTGAKKSNELGKIYHYDLYGKREYKYNFLQDNNFANIEFQELQPKEPNYFFVPKNFDEIKKYEKGFKIDEIFGNYNSGVESGKDELIIKRSSAELNILENDLKTLSENELSKKYEVVIDKIQQVINDFKNASKSVILYRPFDIRHTFLSPNSEGVFWRPRFSTMKHFLHKNIGLIAKRGFDEDNSAPTFITKYIIDRRGWTRPGMQGAESIFPLYLYPEDQNSEFLQDKAHTSTSSVQGRTPNLNTEIIKQIADNLGLNFTKEKETTKDTFAPIDILDYIYAVLHSPTYRDKYKEFLKIDFPRVPYPQDIAKFWQLVALGSQLRALHLLENPILETYITQYPIDGDNTITHIQTEPCPPSEEVARSAGGGLSLDSQTQPETYPPSPYGDSLQRETENSTKLPSLGGGARRAEEDSPKNSPLEGWQASPDGVDRSNETKSPENLSPFGGGSLKGGGGLNEDNNSQLKTKESDTLRIYINPTQYFDKVPKVAWEFYIGGYQPAQKWLKDRKNRQLNFEDILHYQKIIIALTNTHHLMKQINHINIEE